MLKNRKNLMVFLVCVILLAVLCFALITDTKNVETKIKDINKAYFKDVSDIKELSSKDVCKTKNCDMSGITILSFSSNNKTTTLITNTKNLP